MKKTLFSILTLAMVCSFNVKSGATIHTVQVIDNSFLPATFTMQLGDTVLWVLAPGAVMFHTTTSQAGIPSGAVSWNVQLDNSGGATSYMYVPAVSGNYPYQCNFHLPTMVGSFTVTPPTSIKGVPAAQSFSLSPNPARNEVRISTDERELKVELVDLAGRNMVLQPAGNVVNGEQIYSLPEVPNGLYMIRVKSAGGVLTQTLFVER